MVARTAGSLNPAPAAPAPTPFANAVLTLRDHGLAPIPLGGDDGKVPLVLYRNWKRPPGRQFLERLAGAHPTANVGVLTGLSELTVVDVDARRLVDGMLRRFGNTPLVTGTPSGGVHLWYRSTGERCQVRLDGLRVDIRGVGGMVVVPPSLRPSGRHAGKAYTFVNGSWDDLHRLPTLKAAVLLDGPAVYDGARNNTLFCFLLRQVRTCDTLDDLVDVARTFNSNCIPPMLDAQVVKTARSAWQFEDEDRNWLGGPARATFTVNDIDRLAAKPDAFALFAKLKVTHLARRNPFALDARAMYRDNVMPGWSRNRYMATTNWLVESGDLVRVHQGGKRPRDPSFYVLSIRSQNRTQYNKDTLPPGSLGMVVSDHAALKA